MADVLPKARRDELLIEDVLDEILVYDLRSQQAHSLNPAAAVIWRACDGHKDVDALAAVASEAMGAHCDEDVVRLALEQLQERALLDTLVPVARRPMSRREMLERVAVPAIVLPLVTSLNVPTPAMAQSCPLGGPQGFQGISGPQGGCVCDFGPQGPQGFPDQQGFQSVNVGPQGFQGVTGFQGDCSGFQGPQGPQGPQGAAQGLVQLPDECQGPQGLQGTQGPDTPIFCPPG